MTKPQIAVIGDGLIGLSVACQLARDGYPVVCIGDQGARSSDAAAGMLSPTFEKYHPRAASSLGLLLEEGLELWDEFAADLVNESGQQIGYQRNGIIGVGFAQPLSSEAEICEVPEGFTSGRAWRMAREGQADPRLLRPALMTAYKKQGGSLIHDKVTHINRDGPSIDLQLLDRILSVDLLVYAGGLGASSLLGGTWPEEGVRGRAFLQYAPTLNLPSVVRSHSVYFCPKADGLLYVGATEEIPEGEPPMFDGLWWEATSICPALAKTEHIQIFDGVRPALTSGLPEIGKWAEDERVFLAFGHDRNGVLLAPLTAYRIRDLIRCWEV